MTFCSCTSKACLCILSVLLWCSAAGLACVGVMIFRESNDFGVITSDTYALVPAGILLAAAIFIFFLGVIGCVGAFKEQKCLLGVFATVMLLVFVGMVSAAVLAYHYRGRIEVSVKDGVRDAMHMYGNNTAITDDVDIMQSELHCCGMNNYSDWLREPWYQNESIPYPESCCEDRKCDYGSHNDTRVYQEGCYVLVKTQFMSHLAIIASVAGVFACVLLLGMVAACVLICRRKPTAPYLQFDDPHGMRV